MIGFIELVIMVFALAVSFAVYLIHKSVREKETGLLLLALVLFVSCTFLTTKVILDTANEASAAPPETFVEAVKETLGE